MDKEQLAIARLQDAARLSEHRYKKPLMVTYSCGKDSQVLVALAERAGINWPVGGADNVSSFGGLSTNNSTFKRLTECLKNAINVVSMRTRYGTKSKLAWICSTGGWKMAFFPVS